MPLFKLKEIIEFMGYFQNFKKVRCHINNISATSSAKSVLSSNKASS